MFAFILSPLGRLLMVGVVAGFIGGYATHHWDQVAYLTLQNNFNTVKANQAQQIGRAHV